MEDVVEYNDFELKDEIFKFPLFKEKAFVDEEGQWLAVRDKHNQKLIIELRSYVGISANAEHYYVKMKVRQAAIILGSVERMISMSGNLKEFKNEWKGITIELHSVLSSWGAKYKNDKGGFHLLHQYLDTGQPIPEKQFNVLINEEV